MLKNFISAADKKILCSNYKHKIFDGNSLAKKIR